jgi:hypothetical protein
LIRKLTRSPEICGAVLAGKAVVKKTSKYAVTIHVSVALLFVRVYSLPERLTDDSVLNRVFTGIFPLRLPVMTIAHSSQGLRLGFVKV